MATNEHLPPNVIKQLAEELKNLDESPPKGIKVGVNDDDFSTIYADIEGPVGTPYEDGVFRMKLILSCDFPQSPPKGYFLTKIFHPNIATNGEICDNTLKKDWNPSLGVRHALLVVRCLLIKPFPESALNEQAGKMLLENYEEFARHARLHSGIHAKPKAKLKQGAILESTIAFNVDQTNTLSQNIDPKNPLTRAGLPSTPLTSSAAASKGTSAQNHLTDLGPSNDSGVGGPTKMPPSRKEGALTGPRMPAFSPPEELGLDDVEAVAGAGHSRAYSKWSHKEVKLLINAWLNVSKDPIAGTDQAMDAFWKRIEQYFEENCQGGQRRTKNQLKVRWHRINCVVSKFNECYFKICQRYPSDYNHTVIMFEAYDLYQREMGFPFRSENAWRLLKDEPKWQSCGDNTSSSKRIKVFESVAHTSSSNLDAEGARDDDDNEVRTLEQPMGRDAAKRKDEGEKKVVSKSVVHEASSQLAKMEDVNLKKTQALQDFSKCFEFQGKMKVSKMEMKQKELEMKEKEMEMKQKELKMKEKEMEIKQKETEIKQKELEMKDKEMETQILMMDISTMNDLQRHIYMQRLVEIAKKYG